MAERNGGLRRMSVILSTIMIKKEKENSAWRIVSTESLSKQSVFLHLLPES